MSEGSARKASEESFSYLTREMCLGRQRSGIPRVDLNAPRNEDGARQDNSDPRVANPKIVKGSAIVPGVC
jgi:hypothetical protein